MRRLIPLLLVLLVPATAQAGTVGREGNELVYRSAPGEEDLFNAEHEQGSGVLTFEEEELGNARVEPVAGCVAYAHGARCPLDGVTAVRVLAGDADDVIGVSGVDLPVIADLGPGDDDFGGSGLPLTLSAGEGADRVSVVGAGTVDMGPGDDYAQATVGKRFVGPVSLEGGDGRDVLFTDGFRRPGISLSGGNGADRFIVQLDPGGPGVDIACGPGDDSTQVHLVDRPGDGCAAHVSVPAPQTVSRRFEAVLTGPARGSVELRARTTGTRRPPLVARGAFDAPAGPLRTRLKTTAAGRRQLERDKTPKLWVVVKTRTGGDRSEIDFTARLR